MSDQEHTKYELVWKQDRMDLHAMLKENGILSSRLAFSEEKLDLERAKSDLERAKVKLAMKFLTETKTKIRAFYETMGEYHNGMPTFEMACAALIAKEDATSRVFKQFDEFRKGYATKRKGDATKRTISELESDCEDDIPISRNQRFRSCP